VVSVDFIYSGGSPASGDTTLTAGPNQNSSGIIFTGQLGAWNALNIGGNNSGTSSAGPTSFLVDASGASTTYKFALTGPSWRNNYADNYGTLTGRIRSPLDSSNIGTGEAAYLYQSAGLSTDHIGWTLTGLDPTKHYKLVMFEWSAGTAPTRPMASTLLSMRKETPTGPTSCPTPTAKSPA